MQKKSVLDGIAHVAGIVDNDKLLLINVAVKYYLALISTNGILTLT